MKLEITKSKHGYRIISYTANKHPVLVHLAELVKVSNKISPIKIGIYSVSGGEFSLKKRVYSYIANRVEQMDKKRFYKFMRGEASLKGKQPFAKLLKMPKKELQEITEMFSN